MDNGPSLKTMAIAVKLGDEPELVNYSKNVLTRRFGQTGFMALKSAITANNTSEFYEAVAAVMEKGSVSIDEQADVAFDLADARKAKRMPDESIADLYQNGLRSAAMNYAYKNYNRYVHEIIHKKYPTYADKYEEELFQCGCIGIIKALDKYDPKEGRFTTYAKFHIMHEISDQINFNNNSTTVYYNGVQKKVKAAVEKLKSEGFEPNVANIAALTDMNPQIVKRELDYIQSTRFIYLDDEDTQDASTGYDESPAQVYAKQEKEQTLVDSIRSLPDPIYEIIRLKFDEGKTNAQISKMLGITIGKVKSYYQKGLRLLRQDRKLCDAYSEYISKAEKEMFKYSVSPIKTTSEIDQQMDDLLSVIGNGETPENDEEILKNDIHIKARKGRLGGILMSMSADQ